MPSYPTRTVSNSGQPLTSPSGTLLTGTAVTFTLVDLRGLAVAAVDALTNERVVGTVTATTDGAGEFSVALWPNDRGNIQTRYLVEIDHPGVESFQAALPYGDASTVSWSTFQTYVQPFQAQDINAFVKHVANTETALLHPVFTATVAGFAPAAGSAAATDTLRADGSWGVATVAGAGHTVQLSGADQTQRGNLNFLGDFSIADNSGNDSTDVSLASPRHVVQEEGSSLTARANLNFIGSGFTAADDSGNDATTVTLSARLNELAGLAITDGNFAVASGSAWVAESGDTARQSLGVNWVLEAQGSGYTVVAADYQKVFRCTAALTLSVTAAATLGDRFTFAVLADGGAVTVTPAAGNIDGGASRTVGDGNSVVILCDGTNFYSVWESSDPLTTHGDIIFRNSTATTRLAAGTSGQVLVTKGASADPAWEYGVRTQVATVSASSSVTFSSLPSGHNFSLQGSLVVSADAAIEVHVSDDAGSNYNDTSGDNITVLNILTSATPTETLTYSNNAIALYPCWNNTGGDTSESAAFRLDLLGEADSKTRFLCHAAHNPVAGTHEMVLQGGLIVNHANGIDTIRVRPSTGTITGTLTLVMTPNQ